MRQFLLTETRFKMLFSRYNGDLKCYFCEEPIKPKEHIIVTVGKGRVKRWHKECYEKTLH
jgi:hypothetical protein